VNDQISYWFHGLRIRDTVRIAQGTCRAEFRTSKESDWQEAEALVSAAALSHGYVSTLQAVLPARFSANLVEKLPGK